MPQWRAFLFPGAGTPDARGGLLGTSNKAGCVRTEMDVMTALGGWRSNRREGSGIPEAGASSVGRGGNSASIRIESCVKNWFSVRERLCHRQVSAQFPQPGRVSLRQRKDATSVRAELSQKHPRIMP